MKRRKKNTNRYAAWLKKKLQFMKLKRTYLDDFDQNVYLNLWLSVIFLSIIGAMMVFSASAVKCSLSGDFGYDMFFMFKRHIVFLCMGMTIMLVFQYWDYHILMKFTVLSYLMSFVLLLLLKTPLGKETNGAYRWIEIAGVRFQPSEFTKLAVILFIGYLIYLKYDKLDKIMLTIYIWLAGGIQALMVMKISSDLSSAIVILCITFGMSFIFCSTLKLHIVSLCCAIGGAGAYVYKIYKNLPATSEELDSFPYRVQRIAAWLDPQRYSDDQAYQPLNGMYSLGSGGLFGKGLGQSLQKLVIPEGQTDMIFSIYVEELGVFGGVLLILLYLYLFYLLVRVARRCRKDAYGAILVVGILFHLASQTFINLAVNVGLFPNTGIPLPFISYGGSSTLIVLVEMAICICIERRNVIKEMIDMLKKKQNEKRSKVIHMDEALKKRER